MCSEKAVQTLLDIPARSLFRNMDDDGDEIQLDLDFEIESDQDEEGDVGSVSSSESDSDDDAGELGEVEELEGEEVEVAEPDRASSLPSGVTSQPSYPDLILSHSLSLSLLVSVSLRQLWSMIWLVYYEDENIRIPQYY